MINTLINQLQNMTVVERAEFRKKKLIELNQEKSAYEKEYHDRLCEEVQNFINRGGESAALELITQSEKMFGCIKNPTKEMKALHEMLYEL